MFPDASNCAKKKLLSGRIDDISGLWARIFRRLEARGALSPESAAPARRKETLFEGAAALEFGGRRFVKSEVACGDLAGAVVARHDDAG